MTRPAKSPNPWKNDADYNDALAAGYLPDNEIETVRSRCINCLYPADQDAKFCSDECDDEYKRFLADPFS
jgi:hypothetical protein